MKFSVKLTALFSGIFLVIGSITSYLVYTSNIKILESQIKDTLEVQAFHTMDKIDRMLFERFTDIKVIATDPIISSRNSTPKQIRERLIAYRNNYRSYVSLSFFDLNRVVITDTIGINIGKQHPLITYWLDIAGGKEFVFDVSKSIPLGLSIFHFAMVVKDKNGSPFGVVVIRMPVEKLYDITKGTFGVDQEVEQDFKIDLVNKEGLLIYSNYNRKGMLNEILPDWEYLKRFLKSGKKIGSFRHHYLGEDVIHVFALEQGYLDFKGGDWTLIIHAPTKVIFAPAMELRNRLIIVLLVFGFLALFIIFLFSHTMTRPLAKLNNASIEIGKGNLDAKVEISSKDEIGQLGVSFNKMVEDLKEYRDKLLAYSSELETKVAERTIELKNANEQLQLELIERKRAEERLGESEERYRTLFEGAAEGILVADIEGKQFKYANSAICRMLGYTMEELTRLGVVDIHPKEALDHVAAEFEAQARGDKTWAPDIPCLRKDGNIIYVSIATTPVVIDGHKCNVGFFTDITERKRAEEALRESEKRFKLAAESSTDLIYEWDIKERVDWFGKIDELLGYSPSEFPRTIEAWANSVHPEDRDRVMAAVKNHLEKNEPYNIEYRVRKKDGTYNYWWGRGNAVRDEKGNPYRWVGAITDVTERKRAEEALRESEKLYRTLIETSPDAIVLADTNTNFIMVNQVAVRLYGYQNAEEMIGKTFLNLIVPEEQPRLFEHFKETLQTGSSQEMECTSLKKDGSSFPVEVNASLLIDAQGRPKGTIAILRDITERKRAKEALRESEEQYRTVLDNIEYGYFEVDIAGNFTFFNDSLCRILGYSRDETMGMNNRQYMDKENTQKVYQAFNRVYATGEPYRSFDWEILRKDGTKRFVESSVSLLRDLKGERIGFRGIVRDITERKLAEEEREKLIHEIQDALAQIKKLSGLLPICASCKKIRDDKGYWNQIESYIRDHSEAEFSHGICPDCMKKLYPDFADNKNSV